MVPCHDSNCVVTVIDRTKDGNKFEYTSSMYIHSIRTDRPGSFPGICLKYKEVFGISYPHMPGAIKPYDIKDQKRHVDDKNKSLLASLKGDPISDLVCNYYRKKKELYPRKNAKELLLGVSIVFEEPIYLAFLREKNFKTIDYSDTSV